MKVNEQVQGEVSAVKRCTKCGIEKPLGEFGKDSSARDGLKYWCRSCVSTHSNVTKKRYYDANREAILAQKKTYHKANREAILPKLKAYRETNKEALLAKKKIYEKANREAISVQRKGYRDANKEAIAAKNKAYYEVNKEPTLIKAKIYREVNKEKISASMKTYYKAKRERILGQSKIYYEVNKETIQFRTKAWKERNTDQHRNVRRTAGEKRRARIYGANYVPLTRAMRQSKYEEQSGRCYYRGEELNGVYHVEHKIPLKHGGAHSPENIVLACKSCNSQKGQMTDIEFFERLKIKPEGIVKSLPTF